MTQTQTNASANASAPAPSVWRNRNFLLLLGGGFFISISGKVYELLLPLMLYEFTQSSVVMGTMRAVEMLPFLFLAAFIGVFVDRNRKKPLMIAAVGLQMILALVLYALVRSEQQGVSAYYAVGFFMMAFTYCYYSVQYSVVKHSLPDELMMSAFAKFSFVDIFITVLGPLLSGLLLTFSDLSLGLLVMVLVLLFGMILSTFLRVEEPVSVGEKRSSFREDLLEGWREVRRNKPLWMLTWLVVLLNGSEGMAGAMIVFFAKDDLQLGATGVGLLLSCVGLGGIIGSVVVEHARKMFRYGPLLGTCIFLNAGALAMIGFTKDPWLVGLFLMLTGLFETIAIICVRAYRQEVTPAHMVARVNGITGSMFKLLIPFTVFGAGWLAVTVGPSVVFWGAGLFNLLIFLLYLRLPLWKLK